MLPLGFRPSAIFFCPCTKSIAQVRVGELHCDNMLSTDYRGVSVSVLHLCLMSHAQKLRAEFTRRVHVQSSQARFRDVMIDRIVPCADLLRPLRLPLQNASPLLPRIPHFNIFLHEYYSRLKSLISLPSHIRSRRAWYETDGSLCISILGCSH